MKIAVVGLGYVGLSNAVLLAQHNEVIGVDLDLNKVDKLNSRISPIVDSDITQFLKTKALNIRATTDLASAVQGSDFTIISTPTDYDENSRYFDTRSVETVIDKTIETSPSTTIIIKSTIPIGFTDEMRSRYGSQKIIFSPEFLREGQALQDNLYPSRIIIGAKNKEAKKFAELLQQGALKGDIKTKFTGSKEAEAVKLFANNYLAMRVSFFNEVDTFAMSKGLASEEIIEGVSTDPRIGEHYNNPSFGYGGYCLPKDTKQLLANFNDIPQNIFSAIVKSNSTRMDFLAQTIIKTQPKTVGIYRLAMKTNSDNFRQSAVFGVIDRLLEANIKIIVYEPEVIEQRPDIEFENSLEHFCNKADLILANRMAQEIQDVRHKIFTRDIFNCD